MVGGIIFDSIGPWAPFLLVAALDGLVVLLSLAFIYCGLLDFKEDQKLEEGEDNESRIIERN